MRSLLSTSQTDWKQSSDILSDISFDMLSDISSDILSAILSDISFDISSDILSDIFLTYLLTFFLTYLLTFFLTYLLTCFLIYFLTFFLTYLLTCFLIYFLTFFLTYQNQNLTSTASQKKKQLCKLYIYLTPCNKSNIHDNFVPVKCHRPHCIGPPRQKAVKSKDAKRLYFHTHTHHMHQTVPPKSSWVQEMQSWQWCRNYISWRVQTMKPDACHCGSSTTSV